MRSKQERKTVNNYDEIKRCRKVGVLSTTIEMSLVEIRKYLETFREAMKTETKVETVVTENMFLFNRDWVRLFGRSLCFFKILDHLRIRIDQYSQERSRKTTCITYPVNILTMDSSSFILND